MAAKKGDLQERVCTFVTEVKEECQKSRSLTNVSAERSSGSRSLLRLLLKQRFSTIPERGKPQRAEPELENRINESNMHRVYEPGHQGERESAVVCVLTRSICGNESQLPAAVHKEAGRKPRGSTQILVLSHRGIQPPI